MNKPKQKPTRVASTKSTTIAQSVPLSGSDRVSIHDGRLYVSWRQVLPGDFRHIAVASSPDQGKKFTTPVIVSDDQWVLAGCPVSGATLSVGADGNPRVLWYSEGKNGQTGLYWSESRDNGGTFGPRLLLAAGTVHGTPVLIGGTSLSAIWQGTESNSVMLAHITVATASSGNYVIASKGELPAAAANDQRAFVAYIGKAAAGQDVWLVSMAKPQN